MSDVRLDLGEPRHGWIDVSIRIGDHEWSGFASYIADCLTELVHAALELIEERAARPVFFFEEPEANRLAFIDEGPQVHVVITRHPDLGAAQADRNGTLWLAASADRTALARAIWSALRRLEGATNRDELEAGWRHSFPAKEIAELGERLR